MKFDWRRQWRSFEISRCFVEFLLMICNVFLLICAVFFFQHSNSQSNIKLTTFECFHLRSHSFVESLCLFLFLKKWVFTITASINQCFLYRFCEIPANPLTTLKQNIWRRSITLPSHDVSERRWYDVVSTSIQRPSGDVVYRFTTSLSEGWKPIDFEN